MADDLMGNETTAGEGAVMAAEAEATLASSYLLLLRDLTRSLGWRFPALILWMVLVGLGEGLSVVLLLPLLNRMGVGSGANQGSAIKLMDQALGLLGAIGPWQILIVIVAIALVQAVLTIGLTWWSVRLARRYTAEHQLVLFRSFMQAKWSFLVDHKAGELTSAIVTECDRLGGAFTIALTVLSIVVITIVYAALSMFVAWQVTLGLIAFAVLAGLLMNGLYGKTYAMGQGLASLNTDFQSTLMESFIGAKFIKATFSGVDRATARIGVLVRRIEDVYTAATAIPATVRSTLEFFAFVSVAVVLVVSSAWGGVGAANVLVVLALFGRLFPRITSMHAQLHHLNWNVHGIEVVHALQSAAEAEAEREDTPGTLQRLPIELPTELSVRELVVTYGERKALGGIDLTLPMPGLVAVVGGSGAGKSTLVHTLLGLTESADGSVRLGRHDMASAPLSAWRRAIGYVPQETILFHASVRDNITFANPDASQAEIEQAARGAHAHDFIMAMPNGYDTVIGDQGVKLSGGQRQRLGIARALLTSPVLLILDEAMSALDATSELELLRTLDVLRRQMGILVIAHRLIAISSADEIYVFEDGCVAERGTWDALMARGGRLAALARAQGLDRVIANAK